MQRKLFYERNQCGGESVDEWVTQLRLLAKDCAFYDAGDMIKDHILMGSKFKEIQERLLQDEDLNLEKP